MRPTRRACGLAIVGIAAWTPILLVAIALVLLSGCARPDLPRPVEVRTQTVEVEVRAPCPAPEMREQLRALRPVPLRESAKPASALEKAAAVVAQLLRYEAPSGWADRVDAALDRCQRP